MLGYLDHANQTKHLTTWFHDIENNFMYVCKSKKRMESSPVCEIIALAFFR